MELVPSWAWTVRGLVRPHAFIRYPTPRTVAMWVGSRASSPSLRAQVLDGLPEAHPGALVFPFPDPVDQELVAHDGPGMGRQFPEEVELLDGQLPLLPGDCRPVY